MKTLTCIRPGAFEYSEIDMPVKEVGKSILKVERIGICGTDLHAFEGTQPFFNYPRIFGHELALSILETDAPGFLVGDLVTIIPYFNCGHCVACKMGKPNCCAEMSVFGVHRDGGMCEYILVPNEALIHGKGLSADELALIEPLAIGAHAVRRANVQPNENVLIIGAGPIGLGIIEFAHIAGANVIVLDINEFRLDFCKENFPSATIINASKEDALEKIKEITNSDMPTVVFDATGNLHVINRGLSYLAHGGRYVLVGLQKESISISHPEFHKREATLMSSRNATKSDFEQVILSIQDGRVYPLNYITNRIPFDDVASVFSSLLDPASNLIKAMIYC
ncbi:MAG: zinc-binding alcohol dehydrogenase family protein [Bacteroidota bacterium]